YSGHIARVGCNEQGYEAAGLSFRGKHNSLCAHAGHRHGERPPGFLLPLQGVRRNGPQESCLKEVAAYSPPGASPGMVNPRCDSFAIRADFFAGSSAVSGGRTVSHPGSSRKCATTAFNPGIMEGICRQSLTSSRSCCNASASGLRHSSQSLEIAAGFMFAVAEIHPAPPALKFRNRKLSLPENTRKSSADRASSLLVLSQSPELSLIPTTVSGHALTSLATSSTEMPTWETGGMW